MFPYDPALLAAVQTTPRSIAEVLATMQAIDSVLPDGDGLKWFNWLYLQVTSAVKQRVALGGFSDTQWLAGLDVQFARLYFDALAAWLGGQPAPRCWTALFERRNQASIARIQFAMAGINAHINHDLPIALDATCLAAGIAPSHTSQQYRDYTGVNASLDGLVELAKKTLMMRLPGDALPPLSRLEETLAAWNVAAAREAAWVNAEVLWSLRSSAPLSARYLSMLDGITTVAGKTLLVPVPIAAAAVYGAQPGIT